MGKPAARMGDPTIHGGTIVAGFPMVLIGGMPAARVGDMHVCPMLNPGVPPPPHVGGPVALGSPLVLIGGMPAARMGDMATCAGPPDTIAMGCPTVLIGEAGGSGGGGGGGAVAAAKAGEHSALVGEPGPEAEGPHWIEYQFVDKAGKPVTGNKYKFTDVEDHDTKSKLTRDGVVKRGALPKEGNCNLVLYDVRNARWSKDKASVGDKVKLTAETEGFEDGTKAVIKIWERDIHGADDFIAEFKTDVTGNKVEAEWTYEYHEDVDEISKEDKEKGYSALEYYFTVTVEECQTRSPMLEFKDWIEIKLKDENGKAIKDIEYKALLSNGEIRKGKLNGQGVAKLEDVPPGKVKIVLDKSSLYKGVSKKPK